MSTTPNQLEEEMQALDEFEAARAKVFEYFGYREDWRVIPLDDAREYFWRLDGEGPGTVCYADSEEELAGQEGNYYEDEIYTQRHLPKWVYRGSEFTMVCCDPQTDGNRFLRIFSNDKERP